MDTGLAAVLLQNREALLRFLRARGAGEASEDLLQELWLKVSTNPTQPVSDPLPYLYRAAANLFLDRRRAQLRRARRDQNWSAAQSADEDSASDFACAERVALARDDLQAVAAALSALGERTDAVFRRYRLDGVSQRQIAEEMGISLSAVEKHLQKAYRALVELRRQLDAE